MNQSQYLIIQHSLGMTGKKDIPTEYYRNRYVAGDNSDKINVLTSLVDDGYMTKSDPLDAFGGDRIWSVTDKGIKEFEAQFKKAQF